MLLNIDILQYLSDATLCTCILDEIQSYPKCESLSLIQTYHLGMNEQVSLSVLDSHRYLYMQT